MANYINPDLVKTSRRNVLRGSLLAAGAAAVGGSALATPVRKSAPLAAPRAAAPRFVQAEAKAQAAAPKVDLSGYTRVKQDLVAPPFAPAHEQVAKGGPKIIEITMETSEVLLTVDEDTGAEIWALTYNGSVPGPLIICHEGDYVELTLRNPVELDDGAQHRLPRLHGRARRRWPDACLSR